MSAATSCGTGACAATGATSCVSGAVVNSCSPGNPAPSDASCDGVDNNCNGAADEGYVATATSCGIGACGAAGVLACVSGAVVDTCAPGAPAPSDTSCDGVDNNCNGAADEGYVATATSCGIGACGAAGVLACVSGAVVDTCSPGSPAPSDASCDGVDNNCNGAADEGFASTPTSCGVGVCAATGATACVSGTIVNTCTPNAPSATDSDCDNVDDDCNGTRDEDFVATPTTCGVGDCASFGSTLCSSGHIVNTCLPGVPAANDASCNNRDSDCNGQVDEDFVASPTTCGSNACTGTGVLQCNAGTVGNTCAPLANCEGDCGNASDDDGDGFSDCADFDCDGVGACDSTVGSDCDEDADCNAISGGVAICFSEQSSGVPGGLCSQSCDGSPSSCPEGSECTAGYCFVPCSAEGTCDSGEACLEADEDGNACIPVCDADEDCLAGNTCNLETGFCEAPSCAGDDVTCDNVDDDCDGLVDEDFAASFSGDVSCGGSQCYGTGSLICDGGLVSDTCVAPPVCEQEGLCGDASDNDGDTFADCADPDCEQTAECLTEASPVAGVCSLNTDCRSVTGPAVCLAAPGGYCSNFCDELDPSTCPDNAECSGGICLATCNPRHGASACVRPDHVCLLEAGDYVCLPPA